MSNVRPFMRILCLVALFALTAVASARPIPDLVCQETRHVFIDPTTLEARERASQTTYRFKIGGLYIASPDRAEYLYNKVTESEPMRYTSGHKTIQFEQSDSQFQSAVVVHTYRDEVRISRVSCRKP